MTDQPFTASALRGAVDLSALARPAGGPTSGAPGGGGPGAPGAPDPDALVVSAGDATFEDVIGASVRVPAIIVLWSVRLVESARFVDVMAAVARRYEGRFQLVSVNVDENPGLLRAFQVQSVPVAIGLVQAQPVPLFVGVQSEAEVLPWVDELLRLAVQHGVTGRVQVTAEQDVPEPDDGQDAALPPLHQQAFDALEAGDLVGAVTAYEQALKDDPADGDAAVGLAQVRLLQRTTGLDLERVRAAAAADPSDVTAQLQAADLDLLGGDVEDAFARLVATVRVTAGEERNRVREHLLELFAIVGPGDERVGRARRALMSALF